MGVLEDFQADLVAAWSPGRVFEIGSVPASPSYPYVILSDDPDVPRVRSLDGSGPLAGRVTVQVFGRTAASVRSVSQTVVDRWDGNVVPGGNVAALRVLSPIFRDADTAGVLGRTMSFVF